MLLALYITLPWWLSSAINGFVSSPHWQITSLNVGYPGFNGIVAEQLTINLQANEQEVGEISIKQARIALDWTAMQVKAIEVESISGELLLGFPTSSSAAGKSEQSSNSLPDHLPEIVIKHFALTIPHPQHPVNLTGKVSMQNKRHQLNAQISSGQTLQGEVQGTLTPTKELELRLNSVSQLTAINTLINQILPDLQLPISQPKGKLNVVATANINLQNPNSLSPDLSLSVESMDISAQLPFLHLQNVNGKITLTHSNQLWHLTPSEINGKIITSQKFGPVKPQEFSFSARNEASSINDDITLNLELERNKDTIGIVLEGRPEKLVRASVNAKLTNIESYLDDSIGDMKIQQASYQGQLLLSNIFEGIKIKAPEEQTTALKGLSIGPFNETDVNLVLRLTPDSELIEPVIASTKATLKKANWLIDSEMTLITSGQLEYQGDANSGNWQAVFSTLNYAKPDNGDALQGKLQTKGTIDWSAQKYQLTATPHLIVQSPQPWLQDRFPAHKSLWERLSVTGNSINDQFDMTGELTVNGVLNQSLEITGALLSSIKKLRLGDNGVDDAKLQLVWNGDYQAMHAKIQAAQLVLNSKPQGKLNTFESRFRVAEPVQWRDMKLSTQLFGGTLSVDGSKEWQAIDTNQGVAALNQIDLSKVSDYLSKPELVVSGDLSGSIPFTLSEGQLTFGQGQLTAEQGRVAYLPEGKKIALTQESIGELANITLQNFHYALMNARINHGGPCGFDIAFRLEGKNPDLGARADQILNIGYQPTSNVNLYYLLLFGEDFVQELQNQQIDSVCIQPNP